MFVDGLPFVVVFRMKLAIGAGEGLRRLIRLEAQIHFTLLLRLFSLAQPLIAQHKVVMGLQVLGIDAQYLPQLSHRITVFVLQEQNPA